MRLPRWAWNSYWLRGVWLMVSKSGRSPSCGRSCNFAKPGSSGASRRCLDAGRIPGASGQWLHCEPESVCDLPHFLQGVVLDHRTHRGPARAGVAQDDISAAELGEGPVTPAGVARIGKAQVRRHVGERGATRRRCRRRGLDRRGSPSRAPRGRSPLPACAPQRCPPPGITSLLQCTRGAGTCGGIVGRRWGRRTRWTVRPASWRRRVRTGGRL